MKRINLLYTAVVLFACISNVYAQDWPQYLGPNRNSTSPQKGILRTWPASGPDPFIHWLPVQVKQKESELKQQQADIDLKVTEKLKIEPIRLQSN
jgi:hypothetical protein